MASTHHSTAFSCSNRRGMAGTSQILRLSIGVKHNLYGCSTVMSRNTARSPVFSLYRHGKSRRELCRILLNHKWYSQFIQATTSYRQADKTTSVSGHKVNCIWSDQLRSNCQVAFILTVFIIDYDKKFASLYIFDCLRNSSKCH